MTPNPKKIDVQAVAEKATKAKGFKQWETERGASLDRFDGTDDMLFMPLTHLHALAREAQQAAALREAAKELIDADDPETDIQLFEEKWQALAQLVKEKE